MTDRVDVRCENERCDPSALRLSVTETMWYVLDVAPDGIYPGEPEVADEPVLKMFCLDCGCEVPVTPAIRSTLRLE